MAEAANQRKIDGLKNTHQKTRKIEIKWTKHSIRDTRKRTHEKSNLHKVEGRHEDEN